MKHKVEDVEVGLKFQVTSSGSGKVYIVEWLPSIGEWHCPCIGFSYRGTCSHLDDVLEYKKTHKTTENQTKLNVDDGVQKLQF